MSANDLWQRARRRRRAAQAECRQLHGPEHGEPVVLACFELVETRDEAEWHREPLAHVRLLGRLQELCAEASRAALSRQASRSCWGRRRQRGWQPRVDRA